MTILSDPKKAKNYNIPYSIESLNGIKKELFNLKNQVYSKKIVEKRDDVLVYYPPGYEG